MNGTNGSRIHPAWITLIIFIIIQAVVVAGFASTNNAKTNRNESDIEKYRVEQLEFREKIFQELKEIRKDINK